MSHAFGSSLRFGGAAAVAAFAALSSTHAQTALAQTAFAQPAQGPAEQQSPNSPQVSPLARSFFPDPRTTRAVRYSTPDGAVRFVFDRSGPRAALVRFEGDPEVHVLFPVMGSGGDEIYRTEDGDVTLRLTRTGSITVYTRNNTLGAPASEEEQVAPLTPQAVARAAFEARVRAAQMRAARSVGMPVEFVVPAPTNDENAGVVADAAERAAQGLEDAPLTIVRRVIIRIGGAPGAELRGESLTIRVAPQMGYAGRPSSNVIRNVATGQVQGPTQ